MQIHFLTTDQKLADELAEFVTNWENSDNNIIQQTSGSTGKPKEIEINKKLMLQSARMTGEFFGLQDIKTALLCISPGFIGGKMMIVRSIEFDLKLYATEISSTPLQNLNQSIDFAAMVPLQVSETLKHHPEKLNLIKNLIIGGAPVSEKLEKALQSSNCKAYSTFGMTETISHIALKKLNDNNSPFIATGNTTFNEDDGQLVINAPDLSIKGLKTNDIIHLIDKRSFQWLGRSDFTINSGGVKIQPERTERKLSSLYPQEQFIIGALPDEKLGQKVVMIAEESMRKLINTARIRAILDQYEVPREYYFLTQLEKTGSGKVDRIKTMKRIDES